MSQAHDPSVKDATAALDHARGARMVAQESLEQIEHRARTIAGELSEAHAAVQAAASQLATADDGGADERFHAASQKEAALRAKSQAFARVATQARELVATTSDVEAEATRLLAYAAASVNRVRITRT